MSKAKMKELEKLIKEKCDIPIVSVKAYDPGKLAHEMLGTGIEIVMEVKFGMGTSVSPELMKDVGIEETAELISNEMSERFKEKMELAGIKELDFEIY